MKIEKADYTITLKVELDSTTRDWEWMKSYLLVPLLIHRGENVRIERMGDIIHNKREQIKPMTEEERNRSIERKELNQMYYNGDGGELFE